MFGQKMQLFFSLLLFSVKTRLQIVIADFVDKKRNFFDYKN